MLNVDTIKNDIADGGWEAKKKIRIFGGWTNDFILLIWKQRNTIYKVSPFPQISTVCL